MRNLTATVAGIGLAMAATYAPAGAYRATETGYVSDDDGRLYSYVIYGASADEEETAQVFTGATGLEEQGRGAAPAMQPMAQSLPAYGKTAQAQANVLVGTPDVNRVLGRA